jgi:hypothetical protein
MSTATEIDAILTRLDGSAPDHWMSTYNESLHTLTHLAHDADDALQKRAEDLSRVMAPPVSEEWKLCLLLRVLATRRPSCALQLAAAAAARARLKSEYVKVIDSVEAEGSGDTLVRMLQGVDHDGLDDDAREEIIRSLGPRTVADAASAVSQYVAAAADKVRSAAVRYLLDHDAHDSGDMLLERILIEEDPDVLEVIVEAMISWQRRDAVPVMKALLDSDWAHNDEEVAQTLTRGIDRLS